MTQLKAEVLEEAFGHFRRCGCGARECIVYLTAPTARPELIDGVLHPVHSASPAGYDLSAEAIAALWARLLAEGRSIQMQAHTHPGRAYHSSRDDRLALVNSTGALSLVIPDFALGAVGFEGAFLARLDKKGEWTEVPLGESIEVIE